MNRDPKKTHPESVPSGIGRASSSGRGEGDSVPESGRCREPGCRREHYSMGFCEPHYRRDLRRKRAGRESDTALGPVRGPRGQLGDEPLVQLPGARVPSEVLEFLQAQTADARSIAVVIREALAEWCATKKREQDGARPPSRVSRGREGR